MNRKLICVALGFASLSLGAQAANVNAEAAQALVKKNECTKCHALDKKKSGPNYKEVAKKYRGKADAEAKLYKHVTTEPIIKVEDQDEKHKVIKADNDQDIRNVIRWILSLQ